MTAINPKHAHRPEHRTAGAPPAPPVEETLPEAMPFAAGAEIREFIEAFDRDPLPIYAAMRACGPVMADPLVPNLFHVTGGAEIEAALKNAPVFSSSANKPVVAPFFGENFFHMDGEPHFRLRSLFSAAFTPAAISAYTTRLIEPELERVIAGLRGRRSLEFVSEFGAAFPLGVMARMFNVPVADFHRFKDWADTISVAFAGYPLVPEEKRQAGFKAAAELADYVRPIVRDRMAAPRPDDMLGYLATIELEGHRLTEDQIVAFARGFLFAGVETTQRLLGWTMLGILSTPGLRDDVRADPALLDASIEEGLRWGSPVQAIYRRAMRDVTLGGVEIPKGSLVLLEIAAWQRDPRVFRDPDRFDPRRTDGSHLAFGWGRHICMGAHLARLEARLGLGRFLATFPDARLDPAHEPEIRGIGLRSPVEVRLLLS